MMNQKKELEKRMLVKKTINEMNKQIEKLESQKQVYINAGKQAKEKGLIAQYNLAMSGLKMTITQQRRMYEMKLNFEITSQLKDMSQMTSDFLKGMSSLSKDMVKLTKDKEFIKVQSKFDEAMACAEKRTEQMELFMSSSEDAFAGTSNFSKEDNQELDALMENSIAADSSGVNDSEIEKELESLKKKMGL